eukprot:6246391-Prymnesium_polylepis.1
MSIHSGKVCVKSGSIVSNPVAWVRSAFSTALQLYSSIALQLYSLYTLQPSTAPLCHFSTYRPHRNKSGGGTRDTRQHGPARTSTDEHGRAHDPFKPHNARKLQVSARPQRATTEAFIHALVVPWCRAAVEQGP